MRQSQESQQDIVTSSAEDAATALFASIAPLLLKRFPNATPEEMQQAHAYVYGGAIIQDLGGYPFGSQFFSDLTHYVRSGDFVIALIEESKDLSNLWDVE